jgi:hypothetical protein
MKRDIFVLAMIDEMAIVIPSCDKYSDLWQSFFFFFDKYWPDCPYPVYLLTNNLRYDDRVITLQLGQDITWSANLKKALDTIENQRILILLEDYFLMERVNGELINHYDTIMQREKIAYIRLVPEPPPDMDSPIDDRLGIINNGSAYRTSLQAAIWDRDSLIHILERTGSPWEFEIEGSTISSEMVAPFLSVKSDPDAIPIKYYCTAVVQGKWMPGAIEMCMREGAPLDSTKRPVYSNVELFRKKIRRWVRLKVDVVWNKIRNDE